MPRILPRSTVPDVRRLMATVAALCLCVASPVLAQDATAQATEPKASPEQARAEKTTAAHHVDQPEKAGSDL